MSEGTVPIPNWSPQGVLPPINSAEPTSTDRSPYRVSLIDFVLRFGNTESRRRILEGFLDFRSALHEENFRVDAYFQPLDDSSPESLVARSAPLNSRATFFVFLTWVKSVRAKGI